MGACLLFQRTPLGITLADTVQVLHDRGGKSGFKPTCSQLCQEVELENDKPESC